MPHSNLSIVANNSDNRYDKNAKLDRNHDGVDDRAEGAGTGAGIGAGIGGAAGLSTGLGLAIPGVGPVVAPATAVDDIPTSVRFCIRWVLSGSLPVLGWPDK